MIGLLVASALAMVLVGGGPPAGSSPLRRIPRPGRGGGPAVTELADALDVCMLAAGAGLDAADTLELVTTHGPPSIAEDLAGVIGALHAGRPLEDVLQPVRVRAHGERDGVVLLLDALADAHRHGLAVIDRLRMVADDLRAVGRRREQAAARRLGVRVLVPVVVCLLPAFALLTVVPVVADALAP